MRTLETVLPLAEADPSVLDNFDLDEISRTLGEVNGMQSKLMRDVDAVLAIRDQRAKQQAAMQMAEAAPGVARAVKDVSEVAAA